MGPQPNLSLFCGVLLFLFVTLTSVFPLISGDNRGGMTFLPLIFVICGMLGYSDAYRDLEKMLREIFVGNKVTAHSPAAT